MLGVEFVDSLPGDESAEDAVALRLVDPLRISSPHGAREAHRPVSSGGKDRRAGSNAGGNSGAWTPADAMGKAGGLVVVGSNPAAPTNFRP
jgi:hypothetical protein